MNMLNFTGTSPFDVVTKRDTKELYLLKPEVYSSSVNKDVVSVESSAEIDKKVQDNNSKLGLSIAGATILVASAVFFILKGRPINIAKSMQKLKNRIDLRIQNLKLNTEATPRRLAMNEFFIRAIDLIKAKSEVVNNLTTLKDYSLKRFMCRNENSFMCGLHNKITSVFLNVGKSTVKSSYKKAILTAKDTIRTLDAVNGKILRDNGSSTSIVINGVSKSSDKWLEEIIKKNKELAGLLNLNFSSKKFEARYVDIKKIVDRMEKEFDKKGYFWFLSKDIYKDFVADSKILKDKVNYQDGVKQLRNVISYSLHDMVADAQSKIVKITKSVKYNDTDNIKLLREISRAFSALESASGSKEYQQMYENLLKNLELLKQSLGANKNIDGEILKEVDDLCGFKTFKSGKVEEILEIYKALLPKSQYKKVENLYTTMVKGLDGAIELETTDFVNKMRDLIMGSAPTDIITVLSGFVTLAYFLCKSDNNQQRASVALKYGIPALTFIGTSLFFNAKLFAGSKAMLYGGITTWAVEQVGDMANSLLIHHLKKTGKYIEPKSDNDFENKKIKTT